MLLEIQLIFQNYWSVFLPCLLRNLCVSLPCLFTDDVFVQISSERGMVLTQYETAGTLRWYVQFCHRSPACPWVTYLTLHITFHQYNANILPGNYETKLIFLVFFDIQQ